jgi:hypothetical protein
MRISTKYFQTFTRYYERREPLFWRLDVDSYNVKTGLNKIVCEGVIHLINLTKNEIRSAGYGSGSCGHGSAPSHPIES